jgi:hypothetical protein
LYCRWYFLRPIMKPLWLLGKKLPTQSWRINSREIWFVQDNAAAQCSTAVANHLTLTFQNHQSQLEVHKSGPLSYHTLIRTAPTSGITHTMHIQEAMQWSSHYAKVCVQNN